MDPRQAHLIYEFGEFQLDALRRVLSSRLDGQPLPLTGRTFDTLLYLVERAGQLLDKRSLMEALWPNVVVEESNLTQTIHTLRRVLGERPDEHRFIVTVPGRGYRFVAEVRARPVAEPEPVVAETAIEADRVPPRGRKLLAYVTSLDRNADIAKILILQQRFDEALMLAEQLPEGRLRDQCLALVYHAIGEAAAAEAALARLIAPAETPDPHAVVRISIAEVFAFRGDAEEAFKWLALPDRQTREDHAVVPGWWTRQELHISPFLKPLHADPRWQSLLARADEQ